MEGQVHIGVTCTECRDQYAAAGRKDVPCDTGDCKYSPSPGDTGPKGCGLLPENEFVVWLYPKFKRFGEMSFKLVDIELSGDEGETLLEKLSMIDDYAPAIQQAYQAQAKPAPTKR